MVGNYTFESDPYILCDCYYARNNVTYNTSTRKEMATQPPIIPTNVVIPQLYTPRSNPMIISSPINIPTSPSVVSTSPFASGPLTPSLRGTPLPTQLESISVSRRDSTPLSSKLTIYSRSGHLVQRYGSGSKILTLPKSVEIASLVAVDSDGIVIPFSYVPETTMGIALIDRSTGEKVNASVIKEGETITGKILSLDSDNVMLMTGTQITNIREYDRVTVGISDDYTRPRLFLERDNKPFTLSYLLSSISWNCVGTALIDNVKNIMYLRLAGNIVNNTESDITANTILVSGEVYQYRGRQDSYNESMQYAAPRAMLAAAPAPISSRKAETSMLEDYTKYAVGNRTVRNKDVAELGTWSFPVIKLYIHRTNDNDTVRFGYRFTAPGFIPGCSVNVYSIDSDKSIDSYLGSNEIEESQKNDDIDVMLGESTMLQCKSQVIVTDVIVEDEASARKYNLPLEAFKNPNRGNGNGNGNGKSKGVQQQQISKGYNDDRAWHIITEDLTVDITNHNDKPSALVLKHYVGTKLLVDTRCQMYRRKEGDFIEWYFQVPPRDGPEPRKEKFSCQILTAAYY